jgi:hypothetical protein
MWALSTLGSRHQLAGEARIAVTNFVAAITARRRISAESSTISTCFLPGSTPARVTRKLVNFSCCTAISIQLPPTLDQAIKAVPI